MKPHRPFLAAFAAMVPLVSAGEFTVEKQPFSASVSLEGFFLPDMVQNFMLDPKAWADLTILDLIPQGGAVIKGADIVTLDTKEIDRKLSDEADAARLRKMSLAAAERDLDNLERSTPWKLEIAERGYKRAKDDFDYFTTVGRPLQEESAKRNLESAERSLEGATEELKQLLKMYKEDDLTEETEEIILKRQRYQVDAAEFRLKAAQLSTKQTLEVTIPREAVDQSQAIKDAELSWATQLEALPRALEQKRLEVKKARIDDERADEKLAELKSDRAQMEVKAPVSGRVYYGEILDGTWVPSGAAKFMKVGAKIPPKTIFASLIPDGAKLQLHAFVDEAVAVHLKAGLSGYVAPSAAPRSRLSATTSQVATHPSVDGKYHVVLNIEGQPEGFQLVAGMKGNAKIATGAAADAAISIPTNALHETADGSYTVKLKDGDQTRDVPVTLGAESNGRVLVLSGLEVGQVIVTPEPKPADPNN